MSFQPTERQNDMTNWTYTLNYRHGHGKKLVYYYNVLHRVIHYDASGKYNIDLCYKRLPA